MTSSRLKLPFVVLPAIAVMLVGCATSPKAKHDRALARAKDLLQKKDYARAALECRTAVQALPKEPEAYYELGLAFAGEHELQNAVLSFQKALALKPNYEQAQVALAEIMASSADPEILKQAQIKMAGVVKTDITNADAMDTLALTELKLGNIAEGVDDLNRALAVAPGSLRTSILLAQAKIAQKDLKGAEEVLKKACQNDPKSADARVVLARFYVGQKRFPEAEQNLHEAVKLDPKSGTALLSLAQIELAQGQKQQGEESLRQLSLLPDQTLAGAYGTLLFRQGRTEDALREFERLARADPNDRAARSRLVAAYWSAGRKQDADKILSAVLSKNPNDSDALLQRAQMRIAAGDYTAAQSDLNTVLHLNADSANAHYLRAKAYAGMGDALQQRQELGEALRLKPALLSTRIELANLLLRTNGARSALKVLDETPDFQKNSFAVLVERNWALLASGDMPAARNGIDAGLAARQVPELVLQDGVWKLQNGDTGAGRAALERALNANPQEVRALGALYASYAQKKEAAAGVQKVKEYAAKAPHSPAVQELLANISMANGDYNSARTAFNAALAADPGLRPARVGLLQVDMKQGQMDAALQIVNALLTANPKDAQARLWLGNIEVAKGDKAGALANYQQVVAADPKNAQALNNAAYLLVDYKKQPDAALPYAQKAQELAPNNSDYNDTVGLVFYQKGLYSLAVKNFEAAVASPNAAPVCSYHLAMAYAKAGQHDRARLALTSALKQNPQSPEAGMATQLVAQ